jgi:hypothetical protein
MAKLQTMDHYFSIKKKGQCYIGCALLAVNAIVLLKHLIISTIH